MRLPDAVSARNRCSRRRPPLIAIARTEQPRYFPRCRTGKERAGGREPKGGRDRGRTGRADAVGPFPVRGREMPRPPWPELEGGADARTTSANCVRVVWVRECVKSISDGTNIPPLDGTNFIADGMAAERERTRTDGVRRANEVTTTSPERTTFRVGMV